MGPGFESPKVHHEYDVFDLDPEPLREKGLAKSVLLTQRVHLYPFRTQKLSSAVPKILVWRRTGKIGQR